MEPKDYEATRAKAQKNADRVRADLWGHKLPVDPAVIAGKLGIDVVEADLHEDVSGMLVKEPGNDPTIYLSQRDSTQRQRFTCAHEIGHYVEKQGDAEFSYVDLRSNEHAQGKPMAEVYADQFAAELLMPERLMRKFASSKQAEMWQLARMFGVSVEAMRIRRKRLGLA